MRHRRRAEEATAAIDLRPFRTKICATCRRQCTASNKAAGSGSDIPITGPSQPPKASTICPQHHWYHSHGDLVRRELEERSGRAEGA